MEKAIFKIYNEGKFVIGAWLNTDGGVGSLDIFPYFLKNLKYDVDKKSIYDSINQFINNSKFFTIFGDKKKPFINQISEDGIKETDVLFWDISLSDTKLLKNSIWGEFIYEFRFTQDKVKIKVNYIGNERTYELRGYWNTTSIIKIVQDVNEWVNDIKYGLNDCNCGEEQE